METSNKKLILTVSFVIAVVIAGILGLLYWTNNSPSNESVGLQPAEEGKEIVLFDDEADASTQLAKLKHNKKITIPEVLNQKEATLETIPEVLKATLSDQAKNISVKSINYTTEGAGFKIDFSMTQTIPEAIKFLSQWPRTDWTMISGARVANAGIYSLENKDYKIFIELIKTEDQETNVSLYSISK